MLDPWFAAVCGEIFPPSRDFTLCKSVRPTGVLAAYKAPRFSSDLRQAFSAAKSPCGLRTYIK